MEYFQFKYLLEDMDTFDIVVIGGGFSGLGIAEECARHNLKVALIDRGDLCQETSANSLRIIHGGFRYLQTLNFARMWQSSTDQIQLLREFPDFVKPIECLMPLKPWGLKSALPVKSALIFYSLMYSLAAGRIASRGRVDNFESVGLRFQKLSKYVKYGALIWQDACIDNPSGLIAALSENCVRTRVSLMPQTELLEGVHSGGLWKLSLQSLEGITEISSRIVVNSSGPWLNIVRSRLNRSPLRELNWARAYNIKLKREFFHPSAVGFQSAIGTLYFLVPRGTTSAIGTIYSPCEGDITNPTNLHVSELEINAALRDVNDCFPELALKLEDVTGIECGLLPASGQKNGQPTLIAREKILTEGKLVDVLSTKLTTFRSQAREVYKAIKSL